MSCRRFPALVVMSSVALLLALPGCGERDKTPTTTGAAEPAKPSVPNVVERDAKKAGEAVRSEVAQLGSGLGEEIQDAQITAKVNTGLSVDRHLSVMSIDVDTKAGTVTLKGKAPSDEASARATDIAAHVAGVKDVQNQLVIEPSKLAAGESDTRRLGGPAAPSTGTSGIAGTADKAAGAVADLAITTKVTTGLSVDRDLSATKIEVHTRDGVVTLRGSAPSEEARQRATRIAANVESVKEVRNELKAM